MTASIDFALGAVFILFFAANRFNTPVTNRSSTTAGRYFMALFCYCAVGFAFYLALVEFPQLVNFVMSGQTEPSGPWAKQLSTPLFVALLLTMLLPKVPILNELDILIRKHLQDMAAIPYEVRRLSAELRRGPMRMEDEIRTTVRQRLENAGLNPHDIQFEHTPTPMHLWVEVTALLVKLEDWETDRKMSRYLAAFRDEKDQLQKQHQHLLAKAKTCFRLQHESASDGASSKAQEAVQRYQEDFMEQLGQLRNAVLEFISRGVLHSELTDSARLGRLKSLGFEINWEPAAFTFNHVMLLFSLVFTILLGGAVTFSTNGSTSFGTKLARMVMVAAIYCVAVVCAVFPKEKWKWAQSRPNEVRPVAFYLVSGSVAVVLSQLISFVFNVLLARSIAGGLQYSLLKYPWLLATFATTVVTGILIDNGRMRCVSRTTQRLLEAVGQGLVLMLVAYLVHQWLDERTLEVLARPNGYKVPELGHVMTMAGTIGFALGFCIPTWYREAPRARPELREPDYGSPTCPACAVAPAACG